MYCCRIPTDKNNRFLANRLGRSDTLKLVECSNHTRQKYREAVVVWGKIPRCCGQFSFLGVVRLTVDDRYKCADNVNASGPNCALAAPNAADVCSA